MKSLILFLILFIIKSSVSESNIDNYSIDLFIKTLKDEQLFEIIQSIKYFYGQDVAIISCEELNKNHCGNCKRVVIEYMPDYTKTLKSQSEITILKILMKKFPKEKANLIRKKIIKEAKKRNIKIK